MDTVSQHDSVPKPPVDLAERMLLPRHTKGDRTAFPALMKAFQGPVYSYLIRCGIPKGFREDLFQDIFIRIHSAAHTYHPEKPLKPWLFTVVANVVRTHLRRRRVEELVYPEHLQDPTPNGHAHLAALETADFLDQTIQSLPLAQKEVILLSCIEGLSLKETAETLNLPLGTTKTHLHRGRKTLTEALARRKQRSLKS